MFAAASTCDSSGSTSGVNFPTLNPAPTYVSIDAQELATYADRHIGEYMGVCGTVFNVNGDNDLQMWLDNTDMKAVYVNTLDKLNAVYDKTKICVRGMADRYYTGKNAFGAEVKQPLIIYAHYEIQ